MSNFQYALMGIILISGLISLRFGLIKSFKISYYEQKLKNRSVDISHVKNIGLIEIIKL